jgi:hypothetical protein
MRRPWMSYTTHGRKCTERCKDGRVNANTTPMGAAWMADLDARYQTASGLKERRFYSIFYSQVRQSDVLVLGLNPGGDPVTWRPSDIADTGWYEDGAHEYVDMDYPIAVAMRRFLVESLGLASVEEIRSIPKSNIGFRRSSSSHTMQISMGTAVREAAPFVQEIIAAADPKLLILEGTQTGKLFADEHARTWNPRPDTPVITTPNGRHEATIFSAVEATLWNETHVVAVVIGHPSRYADRKEWSDVIRASSTVAGSIG